MASEPFVVVGADAAGLSAASKCRRADPDREVIVFEKGAWISYAYCGMPYFIAGRIDQLSNLLSLSPAQAADRGIDLRRNHEVVAVDPDAQTVRVEHAGDSFDQPYGDLLIATGGRAVTGSLDVRDLDGAFTLHSMDAAAAIDAYIAEPADYDFDRIADTPADRALVEANAALDAPTTAAIVGGGYVGIEMAEALVGRGLDVHLFHRSEHLLPAFGESVADRVEAELRDQGVSVHTNTPVEALVGGDRIEGVVCDAAENAETELGVDLAVVGIGIEPNTGLLDGTDIECSDGGALLTNEFGRTTLPAVYAAGDCATDRHVVTGEHVWMPLGLTANRAGRAIGATVGGDPTPVGDTAATAVVKAFDLECGRVGLLAEDDATAAGFDPVTTTITAGSRSGYYPGTSETDVTLVADRETGRLLGGAIVGADRAAVRINTLATALDAEMGVFDLEQLDLAYAPPFSPVWDPILVAAKVLNGKLSG